MKRTFALTTALALASLGISAYAQTPSAEHGQPQTQTTKKHKKHRTPKKEKKTASTHAPEKK